VSFQASIAALLLPTLLAGPRVLLNNSGRAELRTRHPGDPVAGEFEPGDQAFDTDVVARFSLGLGWRRTQLELAYEPRYTLNNFTEEETSDLLHSFSASATHRWQRVTLSLSETVSIGTRRFTSFSAPFQPAEPAQPTDPGAPPDPAQPTPPAQPPPDTAPGQAVVAPLSADYFGTDTVLSSIVRLSPRSTFSTSLSYAIAGGRDEEARRTIPRSSGPRASAEYSTLVSRRDTLATGLEGTSVLTEGSGDLQTTRATTLTARETWSRQWSMRTSTSLAGGVTFVPRNEEDDNSYVYPTGSATVLTVLYSGRGARLDFTGIGAAEVVIDRLSGQTDPRATINGRLTWTRGLLAMYGGAGWTRSLYPNRPNAVRVVFGDGGLRYQATPWIALELGTRLSDQTVESPEGVVLTSAAEGLQWTVFAAVSVQAPTLEL
jgi:hypothetical protein